MSASTDAFTAAVASLNTDVAALVALAQADASGVQAAVDAFAQQATTSIAAIDATVKAALPVAPASS